MTQKIPVNSLLNAKQITEKQKINRSIVDDPKQIPGKPRKSCGRVKWDRNSSRRAKLAQIIIDRPDMSKAATLRAAGYSANSDCVLHTPIVQQAILTVSQQRQAAQQTEGLRLSDLTGVLKNIAHDRQEQASPRIQAVKTASQLLGYDAPQQVYVSNLHLIADLCSMSDTEITLLTQRDDEPDAYLPDIQYGNDDAST